MGGPGEALDKDNPNKATCWDEVHSYTNPTEQMLGFLMGFSRQWRHTKIMWPDFFSKWDILCQTCPIPQQIYIYVLIIYTKDKSFLDYARWSKKLNFFNTNWSRDAQITSWLRHQPRINKSKQTDGFAAAKFCAKFHG